MFEITTYKQRGAALCVISMLLSDCIKLLALNDSFIQSIYIYRYGHVFMADTGTSVGEISGHGRPINSCDFKSSRPFRIATGSEDNCIGIFEGPPFKFKMTKQVQINS